MLAADLTANPPLSQRPCAGVVRLPAPHLPIALPLPQLGLLGMVEPFDLHHHVAAPRLPQALDAADIGQVGSSSRQEDCTVPDAQSLLASDDGLVEEFPGLPLHASPLQGRPAEHSGEEGPSREGGGRGN